MSRRSLSGPGEGITVGWEVPVRCDGCQRRYWQCAGELRFYAVTWQPADLPVWDRVSSYRWDAVAFEPGVHPGGASRGATGAQLAVGVVVAPNPSLNLICKAGG